MMVNKFNYFLDTFKSCYQTEKWPEITYNNDFLGEINIAQHVTNNFFDNQVYINAETIIWKEWKGQKIPFLFDKEENDIFSVKDNRININFDIVASSFYLLSGFQERDKSKYDELGRFKYSESIQKTLGITVIPVVNYYFDILKTTIENVHNISLNTRFDNDYDFSVCLTHDIDNCENGWLEGGAWALKQKKPLSLFRLFYFKFIRGKDIWFNFDAILDIEKKHRATSSFYFLCRKGEFMGKPNADYSIKKKKFLKVFENIRKAGSEIGIHGSFGTHNNSQLFSKDIFTLGQPISGGRFHFLEFEIDKTPKILEECGLKYDSSLGFAEYVGFRNCFCYPFRLYDFADDKPTKVWEIPLILMDSTLYSKHYMGLTQENSLAVVNGLMSEIKKFNGIFTILWHNTFFSDYKYKEWKNVYYYILNSAVKQNARLTSALTIYKNLNK